MSCKCPVNVMYLTHGNIIFDILESHAFQKIQHMLGLSSTLYLCICVFVYLCFLHLIHGNVIFYILESHAIKKYSTCLVFEALCTCWVLSLSLSLQNLKNLKNLKKWVAAADLYQTMKNTRALDGANKTFSGDCDYEFT